MIDASLVHVDNDCLPLIVLPIVYVTVFRLPRVPYLPIHRCNPLSFPHFLISHQDLCDTYLAKMAVGTIQLKVKSFFRSSLKRRRRLSSPYSEHEHKKLKNTSALTIEDNNGPGLDFQLASPFFRNLPIEIRRMIYELVWCGPYDHKYHTLRGRHIHFVDGHWVNMRCVMYKDDEDPDLIQKNSMYISHLHLLWLCTYPF